MSTARSRTWIGLPTEDGPAELGQIRIERWQRQPHRTLLFGTSRSKSGSGQRQLGPGLVAVAAVSKESADGGVLYAGVRLTQVNTQRQAAWYCPCDVKITLVGERGDDLEKTVRWVMTPQNSEIFFHMLPLSDVEKQYMSDSGALRIKAQLIFHFSVQPSSGRPAVFPLGAHGATLQALMYSRCLAGPLKGGSKGNSETNEQACMGRLEVCRTGVMTGPAQSSAGQSVSNMPVPGLLPPCPELPSAFAQEIIPGLMIASEEALSKLVELHDVGVGTLLQVSQVSRSQGFSRQISDGAPIEFEVRLLQLRGVGDTVELVENPVCPSEQAQSARAVIDLIEEALEAVLSGREGTSYMLVLPREETRDMEPCAALVAVVVARRFRLTFAESQRYVRTRWDVVITKSWAQQLSAECDLLPAELWTPQPSENGTSLEAGRLLDELCSAVRQGDPAAAVTAKFSSWFEAATASQLSYGRALSWDQVWEPCPGLCVQIYDSGWGSASEVFRAMSVCNKRLKEPMIILRMMSALPKGEIFEVPYRIENGDDTWHLSALVLHDSHSAESARPRCVSLLHGAGLWMLDADGQIYEVSRQSHGSSPENWLCTSDMSARAIVYVRNSRPKGKLPAPSNSQANSTRCSTEDQDPVQEGHVAVRIVTEKMLQQAEGDFEMSSDISASTVLVLPKSISYADLQDRVHQSLKIPSGKQLLLHLSDTQADATEQRLFPIDEALSLFTESQCITVLLMFATDPSIVSVDTPVTIANGSKVSLPSRLPLLCKYFDKATLRYVVLGVLLAPPSDSLLHHDDWVRKRITLVMGTSLEPQTCTKNADGKNSTSSPALACCMEVGKPCITVPLRMDWPICEQQITFGSTLIFEKACCGRMTPMPAAKGVEVCGGTGSVISTLIQLVQPAPPVHILGCVFFDSDIRAHRSKGRCSGEPDVWGLLHRMISEAIEEQLDMQLVSVAKASSASIEHGSVVVFKILLDGNMAIAGDIAMEVCWCFAVSDAVHGRAVCRGRLAKHRPSELFLTAGSARGGARGLWHAVAPGCSDTSTFASACTDNSIPTPLLSVLYSTGTPLGDVEVFDVGPDALDSAEQRAAGRADYNAASLIGPGGLHPPVHRGRRKTSSSQAETDVPIDSGNCSASDAVDITDDGDGLQEQRQDLILAEVADSMGMSSSEGDFVGISPCKSPPPSQSAAAGMSCSHLRQKPESLRLEDARLEIECRSFMLVGICYEGNRCKYAHPAGAQLARSDPCPFRCETRDRCPLRICCAFAHGDGERQCPPYIRARGGSCEHSVSSTPGGAASTLQSAFLAGVLSPGPEESTSSLVKRMLGSSIEQLSAVLAEAKALNLVDEIQEAEKQLLSVFLLRGATLPRRELPVPRSRAMSRSSSCDSFLDEAAGREAARLVLALTPGEATQPSTPRSLLHTPAPSPHAAWPENDVSEISAEGSVLPPAAALPASTPPTAALPAAAFAPAAPAAPAPLWQPVALPATFLHPATLPGTMPPSPVPTAPSLPLTAPVSPAVVVPILPVAAIHSPVPPALPMVSWHEPILETSSPSVGASFADDHPYLEQNTSANGGSFRHESDQQFSRPSRFERRSSTGMIGGQPSMSSNVGSSVGFMWHTSPFNISRTPNIPTPVSRCSPARSPTSFSGYCSPITALPSGVTSPTQRRSRSGYSSPSADRSHVGPTFFVGPGTATAQSGLMRRLMSLREAREEKDDDEWSNVEAEPAEKAEGKNLLDFLQEQSQSVSLNRRPRDPPSLCLDLSADFLPYCRRGLAPSRASHCLNAFLQALLPCSPLMHLFAQLSWHSLTRQRPTYACLVQIAFHFFGGNRVNAFDERGVEASAAMLGPIDTCGYVDPIIRRFERAKGSSAAAQPGKGPTETLAGFVHFLLSELHNECKWPMLSPNASQYEDSPINRIFGGLLRKGPLEEDGATPVDFGGLMDSENSDVEPFLVLHLDLTADPCASVAEATQHNLLRGLGAIASGSFLRGVQSALHFERLPPFLLMHLQRFRTVNGVPTRVSRHCHIDMRLELEEAAHCALRTVCYELCSLVCHYGEAPEGGTYKALARQGSRKGSGTGPTFVAASSAGLPPPFAGSSVFSSGTGGVAGNTSNAFNGDWYVFDDTAVRLKPAEELTSVLQCEGYHVCFLMYRREDTKTINIRPHAL